MPRRSPSPPRRPLRARPPGAGDGRHQQRMARGQQLEGAVGRRAPARRRRRWPRSRALRLDDVELGGRLDRALQVERARAGTGPSGCSRIRRTSSASCCSSATMSLLISTVLSGSRKRLAPLDELPWTMPGIADAVLGAHHQHEAAVAVGDDLVLQVLRRVLVRGGTTPACLCRRGPLPPEAFADRLQLGAGVVDHLAGRLDLVPRFGDLAAERRPAFGQGLQGRERVLGPADGGAGRSTDSRKSARPSSRSGSSARPSTARRAEDGRQVVRRPTRRSRPTSSLNRTPSDGGRQQLGHLPRIGLGPQAWPGARHRAA